MAGKYQSLRGFRDLLPGETEHWQRFEVEARQILRSYALREIRVPHLEATELFTRSVGEATDIVGKEMFSFDAGESSVSLRPEMTAQVCRAYIQHGFDRRGLQRLYYIGPAFRKERPQKGRLRQFHQIGVEVFGESSPASDAEIMALGIEIVRAAGVDQTRLLINSIGDVTTRPAFRAALIEALHPVHDKLCADCQDRLQRNPLRVLDCKKSGCQELSAAAPSILDFLSVPAREHFDEVLAQLDRLGIDAVVEPRLVRGLDYYVHTTFELRAEGLGAQNTVLGGGRYDGLVRALGGGEVSGMGWAAGIERLFIAAGLDDRPRDAELDVYLVTLGDVAGAQALSRVQALRRAGLAVGWDSARHGLGGQMKRAGRSGARWAILLGDDELARGRATIKDLKSGEQSEAPIDAEALSAWMAEHTEKEGRA